MPRKPTEWPEEGELIIGVVTKVNPFSAFIALEEYGKEGMVHISEVARKWVRDIRKFVKPGQKVVALVLSVNPETAHISLSLKRVGAHAAEEAMKAFKRESKAEKMLAAAAKEMGVSLDTAYRQVGFKLREQFGEIFSGFQKALTNEQILLRKGIPSDWAKVIRLVAERSLQVKEIELKGLLSLTCPAENGIEIIKKVLSDVAARGFAIKYISAPRYSLTLRTKDAKAGEKRLRQAAEDIIKNIKAAGGEGSFEVV
jgi:translation initiation factor 2 subunit 1